MKNDNVRITQKKTRDKQSLILRSHYKYDIKSSIVNAATSSDCSHGNKYLYVELQANFCMKNTVYKQKLSLRINLSFLSQGDLA